MKFANVGAFDRLLRLILGGGLIALPFLYAGLEPSSMGGIAAMVVGAILVVTAVVKFCPIYGIFGWRTRAGGHDGLDGRL